MSAIISSEGKYRYLLTRDGGEVLFIMLNPSTADAETDDPTIRRCRNFADTWGYDGITVVNLYAVRETDSTKLMQHSFPVGPYNHKYVTQAMRDARKVVCAWGVVKHKTVIMEHIQRLAAAWNINLWCLGTTANGSPRHPLYVKRSKELELYLGPS